MRVTIERVFHPKEFVLGSVEKVLIEEGGTTVEVVVHPGTPELGGERGWVKISKQQGKFARNIPIPYEDAIGRVGDPPCEDKSCSVHNQEEAPDGRCLDSTHQGKCAPDERAFITLEQLESFSLTEEQKEFYRDAFAYFKKTEEPPALRGAGRCPHGYRLLKCPWCDAEEPEKEEK